MKKIVLLLLLFSACSIGKRPSPEARALVRKSAAVTAFSLNAKCMNPGKAFRQEIPVYCFSAYCACDSGPYTLKQVRLNGQTRDLGSFVILEEGKLRQASDPKKLFALRFKGFLPGEPVDFFLLTADGKQAARLHLVPRPLTVSKKNGYTINAEICDYSGTHFLLTADGFEANEKLSLVSAINEYEFECNWHADACGRFQQTMTPNLEGENGGSAELRLYGTKGKIGIRYPWGNEYYKLAASILSDEGDSVERMNQSSLGRQFQRDLKKAKRDFRK